MGSEVEELKKEIESLPEATSLEPEAQQQEQAVVEEQPPAQQVPQPTAPPAPSELDRWVEEFRKRLGIVKEVASAAREIASLPPEAQSAVLSILKTAMPQPQVQVVEKPIVVEKPVEKVVEKPIPVVPGELQKEVRETKAYVTAALEGIEKRLAYYDEVLKRYDQVIARLTEVSASVSSITSEIARLRQELDEVRRERDELIKRITEQYQVLPKARVTTPDGKVIEEFDFHPRLKAYEKQVDFAVQQLGPAIIAEIRAARSDISSHLTRLASLVEAIITPELRRRAPRIVEEIEDRLKRLVGRIAPEEREKTLAELEQKVTQLMQSQTSGGEQK